MKCVVFKKLSFKNFLSVGSDRMVINFSEGINVITGENLDNPGCKNGVGKSTLLNAIYWAIFGETITGLKKSLIQHRKSKDECSASIIFDVDGQEYTIERILEPSSVSIKKGDDVITLSTIDKNDEFIRNLLNTNIDVFKNSVILTNDNTRPFLELKKVEKRKFVEGVMDVSIFGEMLIKVRKDYNDKKKESDTTAALFTNEQKNLQRLKDQKVTNQKTKETKIKDLKAKIETNKESIKNIRKEDAGPDKLDLVKDRLTESEEELHRFESLDLVECTKKLNDIELEIRGLNSQVVNKESALKDLNDSTGVCPTCKRAYSEDNCGTEKKIKDLEAELVEIGRESDKFYVKKRDTKIELNDLKQTILDTKSTILDIKKEIERLSGLEQSIKIIESKNEEISISIDTLEKETDNIDGLITESEKSIEEISDKIKVLFKDLAMLDQAKAIVSEDGVKTIIVKKLLTFINSRLNHYLMTLEAPCICTFDDTFDTDFKDLHGTVIDYWNLSGGERKRVDTAMILTFRDLLRMHTGVSYNLFVTDELFDSSLSGRGLEKLIEILRDNVRKNKESVYIISHNVQTEKIDIDGVIYLEKKDGVTRLKS